MIDPILICIYCGDTMDAPTEKQIKVFGQPDCCEEKMLQIDRNRVFELVKGVDKLKSNLEQEILKGQL